MHVDEEIGGCQNDIQAHLHPPKQTVRYNENLHFGKVNCSIFQVIHKLGEICSMK